MKIGSFVNMSGNDMLLGSVRQALDYGANTFMVYTGSPQSMNRRHPCEFNIDAAEELMSQSGIDEFVIHAPYVVNLANNPRRDIFESSIMFLRSEIGRATVMGCKTLVLHPGAHLGWGTSRGIDRLVEGLNEVITPYDTCNIAIETMAGKGTELCSTIEEISQVFEKARFSSNLRVCFDTCHVHDAGYDIVNQFDIIMQRFDKLIGKDKIAVFHINDSKNPIGSKSDRHANIGEGFIGYHALRYVTHHPDFQNVPMILETPCEHGISHYKEEIEMLRR